MRNEKKTNSKHIQQERSNQAFFFESHKIKGLFILAYLGIYSFMILLVLF